MRVRVRVRVRVKILPQEYLAGANNERIVTLFRDTVRIRAGVEF